MFRTTDQYVLYLFSLMATSAKTLFFLYLKDNNTALEHVYQRAIGENEHEKVQLKWSIKEFI